MTRETMFWIWMATMTGIVVVPMIFGAILVHRFNKEQDKDEKKGQGHDKPA